MPSSAKVTINVLVLARSRAIVAAAGRGAVAVVRARARKKLELSLEKIIFLFRYFDGYDDVKCWMYRILIYVLCDTRGVGHSTIRF